MALKDESNKTDVTALHHLRYFNGGGYRWSPSVSKPVLSGADL